MKLIAYFIMIPHFKYGFQLFTVLILLAAGCASPIIAWQPGNVSTRGAYEMLHLDGEGLEKEREVVYASLKSQIEKNPHLSLVDFTTSGVFLDFHENGVWVRSEKIPLSRDQVYLQIDVVDWRVKTERVDPVIDQGTRYVGLVGITATLVDSDGEILLDEKPYTAQTEPVDEKDLEKVRVFATQQVVALFLADITPKSVEREVIFDDSDPNHQEAISMAKEGRLQAAGVLFRMHWQEDPKNPACIYNLAVVRDLLGDTHEAILLLDALPAGYQEGQIAAYRNRLQERATHSNEKVPK